MFITALETNPLAEYSLQCRNLFDALISASGLYGEETVLTLSDDLYSDSNHKDALFLILDGNCFMSRNDANIVTCEPGDFIGIEEAKGFPLGKYVLNFAIKCRKFSFHDLQSKILSDPSFASIWNNFLIARSATFGLGILHASPGEKVFEPTILTFQPDETIIIQDSWSTQVFTLLSGHAKVEVDGVQVGEVLADEIFGALAAITDQKRTATVIATKKCMVLSIAKEQFTSLIEARPNTVKKLVEDMARTIVSLNSRVITLSASKNDSAIFR